MIKKDKTIDPIHSYGSHWMAFDLIKPHNESYRHS